MTLGETVSHSMSLEVFLPSTVIRGILVTRHDRLSNHLILRAGDEVFSLKGATAEDLNGIPISVSCEEYLIYMQEVLFIADLSAELGIGRSDWDAAQITKEAKKALLHVSPFWIRGDVHLISGASLHDLVMVKNRFIPVTAATLLGRAGAAARTLLVNRTKISCLAVEG